MEVKFASMMIKKKTHLPMELGMELVTDENFGHFFQDLKLIIFFALKYTEF